MSLSHKSTDALKTVKEFDKLMKKFKKEIELVRKFPIKPMRPRPKPPEWECRVCA